jgi:antibiotic biosynthesis monooxygenase (ABM) superfamily enzyme
VADAEPVTVVITRRVKAGHEAAYEDWLRRLQAESRSLAGYLGATVQRPAAGAAAPREYTSVIRFAGLAALRAFERSELRARYLAEVEPHVEAAAAWTELTGLEFWFTPPPGTVVPQPSRARMALVMIAVVFTLVLTIGSAVGWLLAGWPAALRLLVTIVIEVLLMTYWLMPRLTRWLARWIYPRTRTV